MRRAVVAVAALAAAVVGVGGVGGTGVAGAATGLSLVPVARFASAPVGVVSAPGNRSRVFVVEQSGVIAEVNGRRTSVFADLRDRVQVDGNEQGLLGLAFAPDYAMSGKLYVYYTARTTSGIAPTNGGGDVVVSELRRRDADHADTSSERVVLRYNHLGDQYENGGQLAFGPDGKLWIGTGDGGDDTRFGKTSQILDPAGDDHAKGLEALEGKLLRIDPAPGNGCGGGCTIPAGNPGFAQPEVWSYGLRNPWRFSFDPITHDLYIADVGDSHYEEVDVVTAASGLGRGTNFGWPFYEGTADNPNNPLGAAPAGCCQSPTIVRSHGAPDNWNALIGGVVVRDAGVPSLNGKYLYGALNTGMIRAATVTGGKVGADVDTGLRVEGLTSFGTDGCDRAYATSLSGILYRISEGAGGCDAVGVLVRVPARQRVGAARIRTSLACAEACRVDVSLSLRAGAAILGRGTASSVSLAAGRARTITFPVNAATRAAARRAAARGRRLTARVVVVAQAADGSGGKRRATVTERLAR
jgi:glucose/arabinose dehydrogenase